MDIPEIELDTSSITSIARTDHRPYPVPSGRWIIGQEWHDLLFAHWRIDPDALQRLLPAPLEIETYDGAAWLGVVPFAMRDLRLRPLPALPRMTRVLELNVRTYARYGDMAGVYFFSLDASSRVAVETARRRFHLPYFNARMALRHRADWIDFRSVRTHRGASPGRLEMSYRPIGAPMVTPPGSLDAWLVERYRFLTTRPDGRVLSVEIHHGPWVMQTAEAVFQGNTMGEWLGVPLDREPDHVRFARFQDVVNWRPQLAEAVHIAGQGDDA